MRVAKWGDSPAVRLPKILVDALSLEAGDELEVVDAGRERLVVVKDERRKQALERLASMRITLPPDYKSDRDEANERRCGQECLVQREIHMHVAKWGTVSP
jgi:antitoxin MazE